MKTLKTSGRFSPATWIALSLCFLVLIAGIAQQLVTGQPDYARSFAPLRISLAAPVIASAGIILEYFYPHLVRIWKILLWGGILLMIWTANGLPFDLLRIVGLIPMEIDWPGTVTRLSALAAVIALARLALAHPKEYGSTHIPVWYAYAAFILALPYPVLRTCWAFGMTIGLSRPGAAGVGFLPWLASIPWLLAAMLSFLLITPRQGISRRILVTAGWTATAIVATVGPAALWTIVTKIIMGGPQDDIGIKAWIPCLFYGSWFFWFIAAGAATRSFQLRCAKQS